MATKKKESAPKKTKPVLASVSAKLRGVYRWFEEQSKSTLDEALKKQRAKSQKEGPRFTARRLESVVMSLERVQRQLNPLLLKQEWLVKRIKAHWGHTGIVEIESPIGNTLITTSATYALDVHEVWSRMTDIQRERFFVKIPNLELLFLEAEKDEYLKSILERATRVPKMVVSVTAPSSRRAKSGGIGLEDD